MSCLDTNISLTIDGKKNRLRIAKPTMKALGEPRMVQLLFNPTERIIVVRAAKEQTPGGQELYVHLSKPGGDYDFYSMPFVRKLRSTYPEMQERCTYRFYGEAIEKQHLAMFPLSTMEKIVST